MHKILCLANKSVNNLYFIHFCHTTLPKPLKKALNNFLSKIRQFLAVNIRQKVLTHPDVLDDVEISAAALSNDTMHQLSLQDLLLYISNNHTSAPDGS